MNATIDKHKFAEQAAAHGYYSFFLANRQGKCHMVVVQKIDENTVQRLKPRYLFNFLNESLESNLSEDEEQKLKRSLRTDEKTWEEHLTKILPNHFFEWMDNNLKTHKKYLTSAFFTEYLSRRRWDEYKNGVFIRMIEDYAQFKGYTVKWSKGKIWFRIGPGVQTTLIFD